MFSCVLPEVKEVIRLRARNHGVSPSWVAAYYLAKACDLEHKQLRFDIPKRNT